MNFDEEIDGAFAQIMGASAHQAYPNATIQNILRDLVEFGYREGRLEAFGHKARAFGALENVLLNIETLSDGRVVIYVDDPTRCIVLQKTIPLNAKEKGWHE